MIHTNRAGGSVRAEWLPWRRWCRSWLYSSCRPLCRQRRAPLGPAASIGGRGVVIETPCPAPDPVPGVFPDVECTSAAGTSHNASQFTALQARAPLHDNRFSFTRRDVRVAVLTASFKLSFYRAVVVKATGRLAHGRFTGWASLSAAPCGHRHTWSARWLSVSHFSPVP